MNDETNIQQDAYQQYLEEKHSKFNTPDEVVVEEVRKAVGSIPQTKKRLILGENSEVYDIKTEDNQDIIIRISRNDNPKFEAEEWAISKSKEAGVPAPDVLLTDRIEADGDNLAISVQRKLSGVPLSELARTLTEEQLRNYVVKAGEILSRIHSVQTTGFGHLDSHGIAPYTSWERYMFSQIENAEGYIEAAKKVGYNPSQVEKALEILHNNRSVFQGIGSRLTHGDYGPRHILITSDEITGIIDFENARGGDPVRDFAWWDYFRGEQMPLDWLKEGYSDKKVLDDLSFDKRLSLTKLHLGLSMLWYYSMEGNQSGIDHSKGI